MDRIANSIDALNTGVAAITRWLALFMILVQFTIVVGRYAFGLNSIALQESVLYMHATFFMLGAGYTLLVDKHVRVDVFYAKASPQGRRTALLVVALSAQFMENSRRTALGRRD